MMTHEPMMNSRICPFGQVSYAHAVAERIQAREPGLPVFEVYELLDKIISGTNLTSLSVDECIDRVKDM